MKQRMSADARLAASAGPAGVCWPWDGSRDGYGYGRARIAGVLIGAHRLAYERAFGPISAGLTVDHVCHTRDTSCTGGKACLHRRCVNPAHLELVTNHENILRGRNPCAVNAAKTHCIRGHAFAGANLRIWRGSRLCRTCRLDRHRREAATR